MKKFGGGTNVKIWGCFGNNNIGKIQFIDGVMTGQIYKEILEENLFESVYINCELPSDFYFQMNNDPKHTSRVYGRK